MDATKNENSFGEFVRKVREIRGLSGPQLALKCGMTKNYLSEIENGKRNVGLTRAERILKELGVRTVLFLDPEWQWDDSLE